MAIAKDIAPLLPCLRRFSRALNEFRDERRRLRDGDPGSPDPRPEAPDARPLRPDRRSTSSTSASVPQPVRDGFAEASDPSAFDRNLAGLSPRVRQAFLLTTVEGFSQSEAATIMEVDQTGLIGLLDLGARDLAHELASSILIIEDEPIIAMDLELIVEDLGHRVVGVARAHGQAVALAAERQPELIMADIQLEDGGSGIEAVNEILAGTSKPVVFITAHPSAYLSALANRPEPAFLLPKPFKPDLSGRR